MNIPQTLFLVIVYALIIVLLPTVVLALSFTYAYKKGNYPYCMRVVKRMPFIVDSSGIITPEMVTAAAIRSHDFTSATQWLTKSTRQGILPVHRLLELSLLAEQSQWDKAEQILARLQDESTSPAQNADDAALNDMNELAQFVANRNAAKIEELSRKLI